MIDYTPTTEEVIDNYARYADNPTARQEARHEFRRWLTQHDREKADRIESLEAERDAFRETARNYHGTAIQACNRADRAEARLARVTDGSMVERVAQAIFDVRDDEFDLDDWSDLDSTERERYECDARAVLATIRAAADEQEAGSMTIPVRVSPTTGRYILGPRVADEADTFASDDCAACDTPLDQCTRDNVCCEDCPHHHNWPPVAADEQEEPHA